MDFLKSVKTVLHIGANTGQERDLYKDLKVFWVEPIPEVFIQLCNNIKDYPNQRAFQDLILDKDDVQYVFHVATNNGASSSILDFKFHADIWPMVKYTKDIILNSVTLATLIKRESLDIGEAALILDTQGSELKVLQGCGDYLNLFRWIKTEAADFESYENACMIADIVDFIKPRFEEVSRVKFAEHPISGAYYDILFERK